MRRKPGTLVPLELAICSTAADLHHNGTREFYGYDIARRLRDLTERRLLVAYGTLYRALGRLETMGLVRSRWEDPEIPASESRPSRRLYTLTTTGEAAVHAARNARREQASRRLRPRQAPA